MKKLILVLMLSPAFVLAQGPYAPPAGQEGTEAIAQDSSAFVSWAVSCSVQRGYLDIAAPQSGYADYGVEGDATGSPDDLFLSLGDSGVATLQFDQPVYNGPGADFAVFENALNDEFLELAFVEVSSDGENFVRFPSVSLTSTENQTGPFGSTDATLVHNLAGKYRVGYGTGFDLQDLSDSAGIDIAFITHVRIVDVVGSIDPDFACFDSEGNLINDPYPTAFSSGGFDLDAVGVVHSTTTSNRHTVAANMRVYPNPFSHVVYLKGNRNLVEIRIYDSTGRLQYQEVLNAMSESLVLDQLQDGLYVAHLHYADGSISSLKLLKQQ